ncbi:MAG: TIGR00730 family Rossman fold protein [Terracidiphilus sp.]
MSSHGFTHRIAVYCGSSAGSDPAYIAEARALGDAIATAGMGVVYGGASIGLMGALADATLAAGGEVIGVLPEVLMGKEIAHMGLTALERVGSMHERKARIAELADALIALPGGFGTLDEMLEAVTWAQLGIHSKPCLLINTAGYWNGLIQFLDTAVKAGFVKPENRDLLHAVPSAKDAMDRVTAHLRLPSLT